MIQQIPLNGGLVTQVDAEEVSINACTELVNAEFDKPGLIYKRKGSGAEISTGKSLVSITRWYNPNISGNYYWIGIDDTDNVWYSTNLTSWTEISFTPAITNDTEVVKLVNYNTQLRFPCGLTDDARIYQYIDRDFFWSGEGGTPAFYSDITRPRDIIADQLTGNTYVVTNHNWLKEDDDLMFTGTDLSSIDYYYKYSLVFDGNQEAPLSAPLDDTTGGSGTVIPNLQLEFDVGASLANWNKRITGLNIYRATSFDGIYYRVLATSTKTNDGNVVKGTTAYKSTVGYVSGTSFTADEHNTRIFATPHPIKAGADFSINDITDWNNYGGATAHIITRETSGGSNGSNCLKIETPSGAWNMSGKIWNGPHYLVKGMTYTASFDAKSDGGHIPIITCKVDTNNNQGGTDVWLEDFTVDGTPTTTDYVVLTSSYQSCSASYTHTSDTGNYYFGIESRVDTSQGYWLLDNFKFDFSATVNDTTTSFLTLSDAPATDLWELKDWVITNANRSTTHLNSGLNNKLYIGPSVWVDEGLSLGTNNSHRGQLYQRGVGGKITDERGFILNNSQKAIQVSAENSFPVNSGASGTNLIICQNYLWMENGNSQRLFYLDQGVDGVEHPTGKTSLDVKHRHSKYINGRNYVADVRITDGDETEDHNNWIMFSELNQPDVIPISNYIQLTDAQGGKIVGIESLMGDLAVLMENGIFRLSIPSADPTQWSLSESEENIGCLSENSITAWEAGLFFAGKDHLYYLDVNFKAHPMTASIKDDYQSEVTSSVRTFYDVKKNRLLCRFGADGATIYSLDLSSFPEERWTKVTTGSGDMDIFTVDENLKLYAFDTATNKIKPHDDAKSESTSFKRTTGWISNTDLDRSGVLRRLNLKYKSGDEITVKIYIDGDDSNVVKTITIPSDTTGADWYKCKPSVRCRSYKIELSTSASANDVEIRRLEVEFD